jgi:hypothetical protein
MIYVSRPQDRAAADARPFRLGADACPGIGERGHGLTMSILHDSTCCAEWAAGQTSWPARAKEFQQAAARWGTTWPQPARQKRDTVPGQQAGDADGTSQDHCATIRQERDR